MQPHLVQKDSIDAVVRTVDQIIVGRLHVRPTKRLKDELNLMNERFIAVTGARVYDGAGTRLLYETAVVLVSCSYIVTVAPLESVSTPDAAWRPRPGAYSEEEEAAAVGTDGPVTEEPPTKS